MVTDTLLVVYVIGFLVAAGIAASMETYDGNRTPVYRILWAQLTSNQVDRYWAQEVVGIVIMGLIWPLVLFVLTFCLIGMMFLTREKDR